MYYFCLLHLLYSQAEAEIVTSPLRVSLCSSAPPPFLNTAASNAGSRTVLGWPAFLLADIHLAFWKNRGVCIHTESRSMESLVTPLCTSRRSSFWCGCWLHPVAPPSATHWTFVTASLTAKTRDGCQFTAVKLNLFIYLFILFFCFSSS